MSTEYTEYTESMHNGTIASNAGFSTANFSLPNAQITFPTVCLYFVQSICMYLV